MGRISAILLLLTLTSCSGKVPVLNTFSPLPDDASCGIALLPIINKSVFPEGEAVFYKILQAELIASRHFRVVGEGDLLELYRQLGIYPNQQLSDEQLRMIASRLNIKAFIGGDILKMKEQHTGHYLDAELTFVLRIYDGGTGKVLWTTYHSRRGKDYQKIMHFGRINTVTSLAKQMSREIINLWSEKGMTPCTG